MRAGTVVFLVSEDWYFLSHRLPMARAAQALGCRVVVATRIDKGAERIRAEGFEPVHLPIDRGSLSPIKELRAVAALIRLLRRERPVLLHTVAIKPLLHGGLAAAFVPRLPVVNTVAGMGWLMTDRAKGSPVRWLVFRMMRLYALWPRIFTIVQNPEDLAFLTERRLVDPGRSLLIRGSGVDLRTFAATPEPPGPPIALFAARLLYDKGIVEMVEAARILRRRGVDLRVWIAGVPDPANPNGIEPERFEVWKREGVAEFLGRHDDMAALWAKAHIAVQPSYREGVPKALLEAAACARPLVTTDVPGNRELVPDGATGVLVPPRDAEALADGLAALAGDPERRRRMGQAARQMVERDFSDTRVSEQTLAVYRRVLGLAATECTGAAGREDAA